MLKIVDRAGWGAKSPKQRTTMPIATPEGIFVHYTSSDSDEQSDHKNCPSRVRGIQAFHQGPSRGWSDIAYSFVVCKHGYVFEGRGWHVQGAHTLGYNGLAHAVCFLGNDTSGRDDVTDEGRAAIAAVINESFRLGGARKVRGHRDVNATSCPGDELWHWVHTDGWTDEPVPPAKPDGFWKWLNWYEGTGRFTGAGKKAAGRRPNVPGTIPDAWWKRRQAALKRRAEG